MYFIEIKNYLKLEWLNVLQQISGATTVDSWCVSDPKNSAYLKDILPNEQTSLDTPYEIIVNFTKVCNKFVTNVSQYYQQCFYYMKHL